MFKNFLSLVDRQFNCKVKVIKSDNALDLVSGTFSYEFLASQWIIRQTSCIGTPKKMALLRENIDIF